MDIEIKGVEKENAGGFLKPKPLRLRRRGPAPLREVRPPQPPKRRQAPTTSPKLARNPFRCNEGVKRQKVEENEEVWRPLQPQAPLLLDECALPPFPTPLLEAKEQKKEPAPSPLLSVDWSLKTKVRFTSASPFPSRGNFKTFEEVNGTVGFTRCLHNTDKSSDLHSSHGARFFQQSLVWMHPSLPWLSLFPRTPKSTGPPALSVPAQEILHSKWCDSLRSLYQLVRLYQCPYFYVCAPSFTVLFRCAGAASIPVLHALVSPTTRGFRNALTEEGITFSMPLCPPEEESTLDALEDGSEEEGDDASWLVSLGLSQDAFPSLHKRKRRDDSRVDHRPQSLVYIEDSETQALVNFLLNSSLCHGARAGAMAGVPPTLLAPCAFLGGTLHPLQMRMGKVKQGDSELDSVELSGPLLPSSLHSLCSLLSTTQGDFTATFTSLLPTEPFAQVQLHSALVPCIFAQNNLADCGLASTFVQQMCRPPSPPLRTLNVQGGLYTAHSSPAVDQSSA